MAFNSTEHDGEKADDWAYRMGRGLARSWHKQSAVQRAGVICVTAVALMFVPLVAYDLHSSAQFDKLSPSEHLQHAIAACGFATIEQDASCADPVSAQKHLYAVGANTKESEGAKLLLSRVSVQIAKEIREKQAKAFEIYSQNVAGVRHDANRCSNSTKDEPIMSFDSGETWWGDDGRCARAVQVRRDEEASTRSYIPSTLRVNTDMDSSWLADEQRSCTSYPGNTHKVAVVACNEESRSSHNIPVKFWGRH